MRTRTWPGAGSAMATSSITSGCEACSSMAAFIDLPRSERTQRARRTLRLAERISRSLKRRPLPAPQPLRPSASPAPSAYALELRQLRQAFAVVGRVAEGELVPLGALEPEVEVVLPGEADAAVDLHGPVGGARIDLAQAGLGHRRGALRLARQGIERVGRVPDQGTRRLDVGDHL